MKKKVLFVALMLLGAVQNVNAQEYSKECGTLVVPVIYDNIEAGSDGLLVVTKDKKKGVVDSNNKTIVPIEYDDVDMGKVEENCGGLIVVKKNDNKSKDIYGLFNKDGVLIAPMNKYKSIRIRDMFGYEGMAEVRLLKEIKRQVLHTVEGDDSTVYEIPIIEDGVLLKDGTLLTSYDKMSIENVGLIVVKKEGRKGVLNDKGEIIIPVKYEDIIMKGANGLIKVEAPNQNGGGVKYGVFNNKGEVVVPVGKYESVIIKDSYIVVKKNGKEGILNSKGIEIVPIGMYEECNVRECHDRNQFYVVIKSNRKEGAVNDNGKVFIPIGKYEEFRVLNNNLALVKLNGKSGITDKNGTMLVPIGKYENIVYRYGVLTYSQNGKWGVLGENGNQATPAEYDKIEPARHSIGMALIAKDGKIGAINREGKLIVPLGIYDGAEIANDIVMLNSTDGKVLFNTNGEKVLSVGKYECVESKYGQLTPFIVNANHGLYKIKTVDKKYGVVKLW